MSETITLDQWVDQFPGLQRKSKALWIAIRREFDNQEPPMTVRQMFYRMSVQGAVSKTENGYRRVARALLKMRRLEAIPYTWIADSTRWIRKPSSYASLPDALLSWQQNYRRELWASQPAYVEIWMEKEALSGVFHPVTSEFDVPLFVTKGYASETFVYEAACHLRGVEKPAYVYHFGDYDPSGQDAARDIEQKLRGFGADFTFIQAAVTAQQISDWDLPTRPTKKSDSRARGWHGDSVELDAIPPTRLRMLVRNIIEAHIDREQLSLTRYTEAQEREIIGKIANWY